MKLMLTEKQIRVLRYFRDFRREKGIAPTLDEAAAALGVSKITIHEHLKQLTRKGAIYRDRAKARAVAILHDPDAAEEPTVNLPTLPLLGRIAAGRPIEALVNSLQGNHVVHSTPPATALRTARAGFDRASRSFGSNVRPPRPRKVR